MKLNPPKVLCRINAFVVLVLVVHTLLLAWQAVRDSPTRDEVGHLAAGLSHWCYGRFDLFRVNPPLVRCVAVVPVLFAEPKLSWHAYQDYRAVHPAMRFEYEVGREFFAVNGSRGFSLLVLARIGCLPFSLLGAIVCFRWACELYGTSAGVLALLLWCFSPNILGHGHLITPDVPAAALAVYCLFRFRRWLSLPTGANTFRFGVMLGFAQLTKTTLILLLPLVMVLWLVDACTSRKHNVVINAAKLTFAFAVALLVLNIGYGFEGTFSQLDSFRFVSGVLSGEPIDSTTGGNRFIGTWVGYAPVPLPEQYLLGIDVTKWDFERRQWSYLMGNWRLGGWWHYYAIALMVKVPLGALVLFGTAATTTTFARRVTVRWSEELILVLPFVAFFVFVSSQTGFSHHVRYAFPVLPFAFIWASKSARLLVSQHTCCKLVVVVSCVWFVCSSLFTAPHSLSYFNELSRGAKNGHAYLLNSNIDWGQDLLYLARWLQSNSVTLSGLDYSVPYIDPRSAGIDVSAAQRAMGSTSYGSVGREQLGAQPGWYAISVNSLYGRRREYNFFRSLRPSAMAGYSIYIYRITPDEANRVRRELGLPELTDADLRDRSETPAH